MSVVELDGGKRTSGEVGDGHTSKNGDDVIQGHIGDGFGGGASRVAVKNSYASRLAWGL